MKSTIWFDLDGTLAGLYEVPNWLPMLIASDPTPYAIAMPLVNMSILARRLNRLQHMGYKLGIISWLSKSSTPDYDKKVTAAKLWWLKKHLYSVQWDTINIVPYGYNKWDVCGEGILFDDEAPNRDNWGGEAFHPNEMMRVLSNLLA